MGDVGAVGAVDADGQINVEREDNDGCDERAADADGPGELEVGDGVEHTDVTVDKDGDGHDTHGEPNQPKTIVV